MSYILDALKKADQERAAGNVPDLETVHLHEPTVRKHYRWLWILAALFILNGALVALLATRQDAGDASGRRDAPDERVSTLPDTTRSRPPAESAPVVRKAPSRVVRTAPQVQERPPVAMTGPVSPRVQSTTVQEQPAAPPVAVVTPTPVAAPPPTTSTVSAGKLPEWDELSLDFRSGFSMPHMDVHVYDTDASRRFVLVNLQKFREGERLPNGAVIEKILPDGIQLSYQGTRFHYAK
ncbi:MAG: general secretion pathway protein GspB [Gammaproteobacteria bacterium]